MTHRRCSFGAAALLLVPLAALAARPVPDADSDPDASSPLLERDDPAARLRTMREWRGEQSAAAQWRVLQEAVKEREHYGTQSPSLPAARSALSAVAGNVFVNIGPTRADFDYNGVKYTAIDSGRARQIVIDPINPAILYMATSGGGVWKSYDAGAGWEPITDQLGTLSIGALAMDPGSPQILYLGLGDPFDVQFPGIVKSGDGGATWSAPQKLVATYGGTQLTAESVRDIKVDPGNSQVVLVATNVGLFRSTDSGNTYQQVALSGAQATDVYFGMWSLAWVGADTWLATGVLGDVQTQNTTGCPYILGGAQPYPDLAPGCSLGFFRSTDDGAHWTWNRTALPGSAAAVANLGRATLAAAPSTTIDVATARVYLLAEDKTTDVQVDIYRSEDGGKTFIALNVNANSRPTNPTAYQQDLDLLQRQGWYNQAIAVDPKDPDTLFLGGTFANARSKDGGMTWSVISDWLPAGSGANVPYIHADTHAIAIGPDGTVYVGGDGGIAISGNARSAAPAAISFTSARNEGLVTHMIYNLDCAPEGWPAEMQGWVMGGLQDNGTRLRQGVTTTFNQVFGGDAFGVAFSRTVQGMVPVSMLTSVTFGDVRRSIDGGQHWAKFMDGVTGPLGFGTLGWVRLARDNGSADPETYITFARNPVVYRSTGGSGWQDISGRLTWQDQGGAVTNGFTTPTGGSIGIRNIASHATRADLYGVVSNKFAYVTTNGGADWLVSYQPKPATSGGGIYLLSSIALDSSDVTGRTYYVTAFATQLDDGSPVPESFGHLYKTADGGVTWTPLGARPIAQRGLPFVPIDVVKVDPNSSQTLYVGTAIGLYRSTDGGQNFDRFGAGSLPAVEISDLCVSPASKRLTVSTYGRGFWQISTDASTNPAGVKGRGDTNFDLRVDGQDLIDLADAFGSTQANDTYRYQADLIGDTNKVDDADLAAMLAKFGGQP